MPTTGRHSIRRRQQQPEQGRGIYPEVPLMSLEMTDFDERRKWKLVFQRFDVNNTGAIPLGELRSLLNSVSDSTIPTTVLNEITRRADRDNNGVLDFEEFMDLIQSHELGVLQPRLHGILKAAAFTVVPQNERAAVIRSGLEEYKCCPPPLLMPILSLVEIGVFIYYAIDMGGVGPNGPVPFKSPLIYDPYLRYECWRYLSYMLIHSGFIHLGTNLIVQIVLGIPLEMVHGWWRLLIIYLAGVTAGSLATSVTDPSVYLAGASGGVYALLLAHLASVILNWKEMEFAVFRLLFVVILVGVDVGTAIYYRHFEGIDTKVGYAAHIGGALAGLLVGVNVLRNLQVETWEKVVWWISFAIYLISVTAFIAVNIFWTGHFPPPR